jgi:DNA polymerase III epsilon subunit-like protein
MSGFHMVDLETMGTTPGCALVSIGIVAFNPHTANVDEVFTDVGFYTVVNRTSCLDNFLHEDEATKTWWAGQALKYPQAGEAVEEYRADAGLPLREALEAMVDYVSNHGYPKDAKVYGNGADFDNPILNVAARMVDLELPWKWGNRCYRTLKNLDELLGPSYAAPKLQRVGTYHHALDDAKSQALHLWETLHDIRQRN